MSTDSNEVPVSVVDMDVPVTAIDEVLEDYEMNIVENEGTLVKKTISAGSKGNNLNSTSFFTSYFVKKTIFVKPVKECFIFCSSFLCFPFF